MKFFNTSLDDIYEIVLEFNEKLCNDRDWFVGITFTFNEYDAYFSFKDTILFSSENNQQQWIEETQNYEDLRIALRRSLIDHFNEYKTFKI